MEKIKLILKTKQHRKISRPRTRTKNDLSKTDHASKISSLKKRAVRNPSKNKRKVFVPRKKDPRLVKPAVELLTPVTLGRLLSSEEYIPVQKPRLRKIVNVEDSSLPDLTDKTRLRLMARDPNWIHAYWHIAPTTLQNAQKDLGDSFHKARYVLRVHDVTCLDFNGRNANRTFDIEVNSKVKNWYVDSWQDNVSYCAQIGLATPKGEFYPLAESNFVHTPRISFSNRGDVMWMDVASHAQKTPFVLTKKIPAQRASGRYRRYLTEDDVRAYYARLFPMLRRILKRRTLKRYGKKIRIGDVEFFDDDLLMELTSSKWFKRKLLGASEEMVETGDMAPSPIGSSETVTSKGGASERSTKTRKFFFELGTELIVYGRTEPDAQVWHGDKQVPLRPDGTFSLRFALPDNGFIPLDFKAISHDQLEVRRILTSGQRLRTKYDTKLL